MERHVIRPEVYRYYFEKGGNNYLFVVLEHKGSLIGRLYNERGMMPEFELNIDDVSRIAFSSYLTTNPFEAYIKIAKDYIDQLFLSNK